MPSLSFRLAVESELPAVLALWESAKREPHSVWNEAYPTIDDARHDLETGNLYVLCEEGRGVIGTLAVCPENEMDALDCFSCRHEGVRELARIAVASDRHGHGYAAHMVNAICAILAERGVPALRLSVARDNLPARRTYPRVGFLAVGEAEMYGGDYVIMERILSKQAP